MDLTVSLSPAIESRLMERAASSGKAPGEYVADLVQRDLSRPSLDEILDPVRQDFADSGITERQIMELGRRELDALRSERQGGV